MRNRTSVLALPLMIVAVLFARAGRAVADDTACQLIRTDAERQILSLCGPTAVDAALMVPLDPALRTRVAFRVVPDGMRYLRQVPDDAQITNISLAGVCIDDTDLTFICERFPNLLGLEIQLSSTIPDDELADLSSEQREHLRQSSVSAAGLRQIVKLKQLQQIDLSGIPLQCEDLSFIGELSELRSLRITHCAIDDTALPFIGRVRTLEKLWLTSTNIEGRELGSLAGCTELRDLVLDNTRVSDTLADGLQPLQQLQLRALSIGNCALSEEGIAAVEQLLPFTEVVRDPVIKEMPIPRWMTDVQSIRRSRDAMRALRGLAGQDCEFVYGRSEADGEFLAGVSLEGCRQPIDGLAVYLANLGTLTGLNLTETPATSACIKELLRLPHLQVLNCARTLVDDTAVNDLVQLTSLNSLDLSGTSITDAGVAGLTRLTGLEKLLLHSTPVTDERVGRLAELPNLMSLGLADCQVTDASEQHLLRIKNLRELGLCETSVTLEMLHRLRKARPELTLHATVAAEKSVLFEQPASESDENNPVECRSVSESEDPESHERPRQ